MAPERTLPNPLSGEEIVKAIQYQIGNRLSRDCFLTPNLAYDSFRAKITIEVVAHDSGRDAEVNVTEVVRSADAVPEDDAMLEKFEAEFEMDPAAPNEVRQETDQPVPVLTKGADGKPEIKGVRYGKRKVAVGE